MDTETLEKPEMKGFGDKSLNSPASLDLATTLCISPNLVYVALSHCPGVSLRGTTAPTLIMPSATLKWYNFSRRQHRILRISGFENHLSSRKNIRCHNIPSLETAMTPANDWLEDFMLKRLMLTQTQQKLLLTTPKPSHGFKDETHECSLAVTFLCAPTHP